MKKVMVRYKVKPEHAAHNKELVRRVYEELREATPAGIGYATFVLDDDVSFVHVATFEERGEQNPLMRIAAFRAFQENIADRCDEPPHLEELHEVGSYRA